MNQDTLLQISYWLIDIGKHQEAERILHKVLKLDPLVTSSGHLRLLSRLAVLIVSSAYCLGPAARMRTRTMYSNMEDWLKPHEKSSDRRKRQAISMVSMANHSKETSSTQSLTWIWILMLAKMFGEQSYRSPTLPLRKTLASSGLLDTPPPHDS